MANTISGVASGIDWEGLIEDALEAARGPAYIQAAKRDTLELRKSLFEELKVDFQALQSSLSSIKIASTFKAKQVNIERLDSSGSYKGVLSATVSADADVNVYDLEVLQIAKSQVSRSSIINGTLGSNPTEFGKVGKYFYVNAGGQKLRVDVTDTDTAATIADKINTTLKTSRPPIAVTASVIDNKLVLKSDSVGSGQTTLTSNLKRGPNNIELIEFPLDASNYEGGMYTISTLGEGGGKLVITSGGTTYNEGVDFDILSGGRIRWRDVDNPYVTANDSYKITYKMNPGETYTTGGTRSSGNTDVGALNFNAHIEDLTPGNVPPSPTYNITISAGSFVYKYDEDFTVASNGKDIIWKNAATLSAGTPYTINYTSVTTAAATDEVFTLDVKREVPDAVVTVGSGTPVAYSDFDAGTVATITSASGKTYRQGVDFDIVSDTATGNAAVRWRKESAHIAPEPGEDYTLSFTDATTGITMGSDSITMSNMDNIDLANYGFGGATLSGALTVSYNGNTLTPGVNYTLTNPVAGTPTTFDINWTRLGGVVSTPHATPALGADYTVSYTYDTNTFTFSDDGNGLLNYLGLGLTDADHYTAGQDAILILDGERVTRSSNTISADNKNELIKGMTIELKGIGRVSLDVEQDAEAAVTAVQNFLTAYNDIMSWINVRETEKQLDETTKSTIDSDDFRMKWGLLRSNPMLRTTKESLRRLTSQIYSPTFTSRTSRRSVYGDMGLNGLMADRTITISAGSSRVLSVQVTPADMLSDIVAKINSNTTDIGYPNPLKDYDANGNPTIPYVTAKIENGQIVLTANQGISAYLGGSTEALSAMSINYSYNTLSQIGIKLKSTGEMSEQGKTGELDFDTNAFMSALANNADDVANLMTTFAAQTQKYIDNTIKTSQAEIGVGVVAVQGSLAREMNAIDDEIKRIDNYLADFSRRQTEKEAKLRSQFAASETLLAKYMEQANWLSSVVTQLQGQQAS
ncbi:hypothetical protein FACS1894204_00750 [Synergistales bacterium]|nr:hypothetical protein FACS1894204_00750 [Synergistales bacterium]